MKLKRQLVQEAKRNLFTVFTRPRRTVISLISTTPSSSAAFPGGEAFEFSFSPQAQWCLAISSSRIIVLDTASQDVSVKRELKVVRKPLSAFILQDGSRLAVLSTDHKVNIYNLSEELPKFVRSVALDDPAHAITLTPGGEVLAVAYDGGVEVWSLADYALPTDKRAVKCDRVDHLSFSADGTMLLGTTQNSKSPSTVILSAPYFADSADQDLPHSELISHMWTSQILFPNSSRDSSHATLLPRKIDHDANWTLTYDRVFESFRAVRTDDLRNGTTYFTGPTGPKPKKERERERSKSTLVPCTLPTITPKGELVAAGFLGSEIWLYGVPEDLDNPGVTDDSSQAGTNSTSGSPAGSPGGQFRRGRSEFERLPRWQVLVDKYRNVFAKGKRIAKISGATQVCWSSPPAQDEGPCYIRERLIIAAPGGLSGPLELDQDEMASLDGGRLVILDFDWSPQGDQSDEVVIEVGSAKPQLLEEENTDMATEIAIVRRRTVARRDNIPRSNVASVVDVLRPPGDVPPVPPLPTSVGFGLDSTVDENTGHEEPDSPTSPTGVTLEEAVEALDGPYSHTHPRSRNTLYRSATAVEANRRRHPPQIPASGRVEYRRTDGTELPHESDADNWVPPPPPYTKDADGPIPDHLQRIIGVRNTPSPALGVIPRRPVGSRRSGEHSAEAAAFRRRSHADADTISRSSSRRSDATSGHHRHVSQDTSSPIQESDIVSPVSQNSVSENTPSSRNSRTSSPAPSSRRPVSSYEPRSSLYRAALRPASPFAPIEEPSTLPHPSRRPIDRISRSSSLSISGANLQQRLDYPLPPPPQATQDSSPPSPQEPPISTQQLPSQTQRPLALAQRPSAPTHLSSNPSVPAISPLTPPTQPRQIPSHAPTISQTSPHPPRTSSRMTTSHPAEPSAYQLNNLENRHSMQPLYGPPINTSPLPPSPRTSRFRSPFRRNASHSHLRVSSAFDVSPTTAGAASFNQPSRLDTIYSLNQSAVPAGGLGGPVGSRPESRVSDSRAGSRLGKRFSRFRAKSEDPNALYGHNASQSSLGGNGQSGWVGRGRRRGRGGVEAEIWEEVVPEETSGEVGRERRGTIDRRRDGRRKRANTEGKEREGGRCVLM